MPCRDRSPAVPDTRPRATGGCRLSGAAGGAGRGQVMTVSFHKYGEYFPGTGDTKDIGAKAGKHHSVRGLRQQGRAVPAARRSATKPG